MITIHRLPSRSSWKQPRIIRFPFLLLILLLSASCATNIKTTSVSSPGYPSRDVSTCFYDFTEVYKRRIYNVLTSAPGVSDVRQIEKGCEDSDNCLCYDLQYEGAIDALGSWIRKNLRTSKVLTFRLVPKGENRLEVYFHGGFE